MVDVFSNEESLHLFEGNANDPDTDGPRARSQHILFPEALGTALPLVALLLPIVSADTKRSYPVDWDACAWGSF